MKKILVCLLAAAMLLSLLTACGQKEDEPGGGQPEISDPGSTPGGDTADGDNADEDTPAPDLTAFFTQLEQDMELGSLMDMDGDVLANFYPGLENYAFVQYVGKTPAISSVVSEYVLVECQSEDEAEEVVKILQARVDAQAQGGAGYPESMDAWAKAKVLQNGKFAALIAAGDETETISAKFEELLAQ